MSDHSILSLTKLHSVVESTWMTHAEFHDSLPSTSDWLVTQLESNSQIAVPRLVFARTQTAGRGRGENQWLTSSGTLTFSFAFDPVDWGIAASHWPLLSLISAMAMAEALTTIVPQVQWQCKWPNDVFGNGRKACGILLEVPPIRPPRLVIGIGVNVNNRVTASDAEWNDRATSLIELCGHPTELSVVLREFLLKFRIVADAVFSRPETLPGLWARTSFLVGRRVTIQTVGGELVGDVEGVDRSGAIRIRTDTRIETCTSGTVIRYE